MCFHFLMLPDTWKEADDSLGLSAPLEMEILGGEVSQDHRKRVRSGTGSGSQELTPVAFAVFNDAF